MAQKAQAWSFTARNVGLWRVSAVEDQLRHAYPSRLSGGERQRVALARALAIGPRGLLLDESFSHLDAHVRRQLHELVRRLRERTHIPLVLVTHDREDVLELCDYVVVMQDGMVVQEGPIREVFTRPASRAVARLVGIANVLSTHGCARTWPRVVGTGRQQPRACREGAEQRYSHNRNHRRRRLTLCQRPDHLELVMGRREHA